MVSYFFHIIWEGAPNITNQPIQFKIAKKVTNEDIPFRTPIEGGDLPLLVADSSK